MGELDYFNNYARYRVEANGKLVGMTFQTGMIGPIDSLLSLGLVEHEFAKPGTQVEIIIGEHHGSGAAGAGEPDFKRIQATVSVAPRHLFQLLWEPKSRAHERDATREALVAFITEGWDSLNIEAAPTREGVAHSIPPTNRAETEE